MNDRVTPLTFICRERLVGSYGNRQVCRSRLAGGPARHTGHWYMVRTWSGPTSAAPRGAWRRHRWRASPPTSRSRSSRRGRRLAVNAIRVSHSPRLRPLPARGGRRGGGRRFRIRVGFWFWIRPRRVRVRSWFRSWFRSHGRGGCRGPGDGGLPGPAPGGRRLPAPRGGGGVGRPGGGRRGRLRGRGEGRGREGRARHAGGCRGQRGCEA